MSTLTDDVVRYQRTGEGYQEIHDRICLFVYGFPSRCVGFSEEDSSEFLLLFHPRIRGLVNRFRATGVPFESYLQTTLRWQLKTLASSRTTQRIRLFASESLDIAASMHPELNGGRTSIADEPTGGDRPRSSRGGQPTGEVVRPSTRRKEDRRGFESVQESYARRLVMLALKAAEVLPEMTFRRIATVTRCDEEWLLDRWSEVRSRCADQRLRRKEYETMRNRAWFKIRCLELRLSGAVESGEREYLNGQLVTWRRRLARARHLVTRMPTGPTHRQIAEALAVPKGTVDSGIHYARRGTQASTLAKVVAQIADNA